MNQETADAIIEFVRDGTRDDLRGNYVIHKRAFEAFINSLVAEDELEWWEKCACKGLDPNCACQSEALRNNRKETDEEISLRMYLKYIEIYFPEMTGEEDDVWYPNFPYWLKNRRK